LLEARCNRRGEGAVEAGFEGSIEQRERAIKSRDREISTRATENYLC